MGREAGIGIEFPGIYFYDGQTFAVPADKKNIQRLEDLERYDDLCCEGNNPSINMAHFFNKRGITYTPLVVDSQKEMCAAFAEGAMPGLHLGALGACRTAGRAARTEKSSLKYCPAKFPRSPLPLPCARR